MTKPNATAVKHDAGKPQVSLLLCPGGVGISRALTFGAVKYQDAFNYLRGNGLTYRQLADASGRHMAEFLARLEKDEQSGLNPIYHAGASILMLTNLVAMGRGVDDRFEP